MRIVLAMVAVMVFGLLGCDPSETTGTGGSGGETAGGGGQGGSGGAGGEDCHPKDPECVHYVPDPEIEYTVAAPYEVSEDGIIDAFLDGADCSPFSRLTTEDGSWTRVTMVGPGGDPSAVRWIAARGGGAAIPANWQMSIINVAPSLDPSAVECGTAGVFSPPPIEIGSVGVTGPAGEAEAVVLEIGLTPESEVEDGSAWVLCLKNYVDADLSKEGNQSSAIIMCGMPDGNPERDEWQDNIAAGSQVHAMCSYGSNYCGGWMATIVLPAQPDKQ